MYNDKITHPHEMATAYILMKCQTGFEKQAIENLENIEGVKKINRIIGAFDLLVKLVSPDYDSLKRIVRLKIMKIDHVECYYIIVYAKALCVTLD